MDVCFKERSIYQHAKVLFDVFRPKFVVSHKLVCIFFAPDACLTQHSTNRLSVKAITILANRNGGKTGVSSYCVAAHNFRLNISLTRGCG